MLFKIILNLKRCNHCYLQELNLDMRRLILALVKVLVHSLATAKDLIARSTTLDHLLGYHGKVLFEYQNSTRTLEEKEAL
jgi:hypothetical protein